MCFVGFIPPCFSFSHSCFLQSFFFVTYHSRQGGGFPSIQNLQRRDSHWPLNYIKVSLHSRALPESCTSLSEFSFHPFPSLTWIDHNLLFAFSVSKNTKSNSYVGLVGVSLHNRFLPANQCKESCWAYFEVFGIISLSIWVTSARICQFCGFSPFEIWKLRLRGGKKDIKREKRTPTALRRRLLGKGKRKKKEDFFAFRLRKEEISGLWRTFCAFRPASTHVL